jgi:hypothetical protein
MEGVTGSIPVAPTIFSATSIDARHDALVYVCLERIAHALQALG